MSDRPNIVYMHSHHTDVIGYDQVVKIDPTTPTASPLPPTSS